MFRSNDMSDERSLTHSRSDDSHIFSFFVCSCRFRRAVLSNSLISSAYWLQVSSVHCCTFALIFLINPSFISLTIYLLPFKFLAKQFCVSMYS